MASGFSRTACYAVTFRLYRRVVRNDDRPSPRGDAFPIDTALERGGGTVDCLLVESLRHQHHPNGQPVDHAAGDAHRWMMRAVELCGIRQHLKAAL